MEHSRVKVAIIGANERETSSEVRVLTRSKRERRIRAFKSASGLLVLGALSVFVPVLHFVLVPAFLIGSGIAAVTVYKQDSVIERGNGTCPECRTTVNLPKVAPRWPLKVSCPGCSFSLFIDQAGGNRKVSVWRKE